jgi:hypothetical protein
MFALETSPPDMTLPLKVCYFGSPLISLSRVDHFNLYKDLVEK